MSGISLYLIAAHYEADLTAEMTSSLVETSIKSFDDVIKREYKVIVREGAAQHMELKYSAPGTAKYQVYQDHIKDNSEAILKAEVDPLQVMRQQDKTLFYYSSTASLVQLEKFRGWNFLPIQGVVDKYTSEKNINCF